MVNVLWAIALSIGAMVAIYTASMIIFNAYFYCKKQYELNLIEEVRKHGKE